MGTNFNAKFLGRLATAMLFCSVLGGSIGCNDAVPTRDTVAFLAFIDKDGDNVAAAATAREACNILIEKVKETCLALFDNSSASSALKTGDCKDDPALDPIECVGVSFVCSDVEFSRCAKCIHPDATEQCDGVDNDCDGDIDEGLTGCCHADVDCPAGEACDTSTVPFHCIPNCLAVDACETANMVEGVCIHEGVDCTDGDACTDDACDPATGCVHTPHSCDDANACTTDSCDPTSGCQYTVTSIDDGDACTVDTCTPATGPVHTLLDCNDDDVCTTDTCNPATGCEYSLVVTDDGDACTVDSCDPATNVIHTPITCDDGNVCTTDTCDAATGCVHTAIVGCCVSGADCEDNNSCTADACDVTMGTCSNLLIACDDANACTTDSCDPTSGCQYTVTSIDDGDACTVDTCTPATGPVHTLLDCNDDDVCTTDTCNPATGCEYSLVVTDDGDACTVDSCDPLNGVTHVAINCDDADPCITDACDPTLGCVHTAIPLCCSNGNDAECSPWVPNGFTAVGSAWYSGNYVFGCLPPNPTILDFHCGTCTDIDRDGYCDADEQNCGNAIDDNGNGRTDCEDLACLTAVVCGGCAQTSDCGPAQVCNPNTFKCETPTCPTPADECSSYVVANHVCVLQNTADGTECSVIGTGYQCLNGECVATWGCVVNADCNDGVDLTLDFCLANHQCAHAQLFGFCWDADNNSNGKGDVCDDLNGVNGYWAPPKWRFDASQPAPDCMSWSISGPLPVIPTAPACCLALPSFLDPFLADGTTPNPEYLNCQSPAANFYLTAP